MNRQPNRSEMQPETLASIPTDINFLSDEDLDLRNLSEAERDAAWSSWFSAAQATNAEDELYYSHSCFGWYAPYPLGPRNWRRE